MKKRVFILFLLTNTTVFAQTARIWADSTRVETGNLYRIYVQTSGAQPPKLDISAWSESIAPENILSISDWKSTQSDWKSEITCIFFDSAELVLPPLQPNGLRTDSLSVSVYPTPIGDTTLAPIHEISLAPPAEPEKPNYWLLAAAVALLAAIVGILYYFLTRKKQPKEPHKFEPIRHEDAWRTQFNTLYQRIPCEPQKPYYDELSYLLRSWLELHHKIPALERTTDELLTVVAGSPALRTQSHLIAQVLERADLVKFAKEEPPIERQMDSWQTVRAIVE
jgi:hypothetical protein